MAIINNQWMGQAHSSAGIHWTSTAATAYKCMFVSTLYSSALFADVNTVDDGTTTDLASREVPGSSVRVNITSRTITVNDASNRVQYDCADWSVTSTGGNLGGIAIVGPGTADNARIPVVFFAATEWSTAGLNLDGNQLTFSPTTVGVFKSSGA